MRMSCLHEVEVNALGYSFHNGGALQSMQGQRALGFHQKYLNL